MDLNDFRIAWRAAGSPYEDPVGGWVEGTPRESVPRRGVPPRRRAPLVQLSAGLSLLLLVGGYALGGARAPHLLVPALLVGGYGLLVVLVSAWTLIQISGIDCTAPVIRMQRHLEELHRWRSVAEWPLLGIAGCFVWIPLLQVGFSAAGLDLWATHPHWIYGEAAVACFGATALSAALMASAGPDASSREALRGLARSSRPCVDRTKR